MSQQNAHRGGCTPPATTLPDPATWVDSHGQVLYRYALSRVRRPDIAEELVQETFLAALKVKDRFQGRSSERTWLTGILKHKILDFYRARGRSLPENTPSTADDGLSNLFDERGHWISPPEACTFQPESLAEQEEFWDVFELCLDRLAPRAREAFVQRIVEEEEIENICKALAITATNLYVILFRARAQMRRCLTLKWFREHELPPTAW